MKATPRPVGYVLDMTDVVAEDQLSPEDRAERGAWVGSIAGALSRSEYEAGLAAAGFEQVSVAFTHQVGEGLHSAVIKATKPAPSQHDGDRQHLHRSPCPADGLRPGLLLMSVPLAWSGSPV